MLDHVSLGVSDLERSRLFYDAALKPLGVERLAAFEERGYDYGVGSPPLGIEFTITKATSGLPSPGMHLCFAAPSRDAVIDFHVAALANGGRSDGEPGVRPQYHPDYFAAFVFDPDGHRVEAVCHVSESVRRDAAHHFDTMMQERCVRIRRAVGLDADTVATLARTFHAEDGHPLSDAGEHALLLMLEPGFRDGLVLLLEVNGKSSGYGVLSYGYGIEHGGPETFLEDLYVVPEQRGTGLGGLLLVELEKQAREAGCRAIHLEVMPQNRAEHWYRRLGWNDRGSKLLTKALLTHA